mmetsp:Transcript_14810/g.46340  ORF Transcript_14810/g.46340 Transcript_14810/m.46340 type:complete len:178 (-) Transcript_14810:32-565(-)
MLLPMPAMPVHTGASAFGRRMKPWMCAMLVVQTILCVLRFCMLLDIMGGFIMAIVVGLGWYAWSQDMHITFICYWGIMGLINGVFGLVQLIDGAVHSPLPMFSSLAPPMYNIKSAIRLLEEISLIVGALIAWVLYKRHDEPEAVGGWGREATSTEAATFRSHGTFQTFGGQGRRLGA